MSSRELKHLGVWWLPSIPATAPASEGSGQGRSVLPAFVTRLHARYNPNTFSEDLVLRVTQDPTNFQGRYIVRHPFTGNSKCEASDRYREHVRYRREQEITNLNFLTAWNRRDIRKQMEPLPAIFQQPPPQTDKAWVDKMKSIFRE